MVIEVTVKTAVAAVAAVAPVALVAPTMKAQTMKPSFLLEHICQKKANYMKPKFVPIES